MIINRKYYALDGLEQDVTIRALKAFAAKKEAQMRARPDGKNFDKHEADLIMTFHVINNIEGQSLHKSEIDNARCKMLEQRIATLEAQLEDIKAFAARVIR